MSDQDNSQPVVVVALPRKPRYARRAARPATDRGAPEREAEAPRGKRGKAKIAAGS